MESEDDTQGEVDLDGELLLPGDALLHQAGLDVDDVEDHGYEVAEDHEGHHEPPGHISSGGDALSPLLHLTSK